MSIRRIGFNPFVQTANIIEAQRRIEAQHRVDAVEKSIGTDDPALMTEEQALEALNAKHRAEMEALEAERAQKELESQALRAQLTLADGYETAAQREMVDLKGGKDVAKEALPSASADKPGVSLAHLARANVYESVSRAERAAAEQLAALERAAAEQEAAGGAGAGVDDWMAAEVDALQVDDGSEVEAEEDPSWMEAELSALQAQAEALEEEEVYSDPGADTFLASLDDIENLEQGGRDFGDAGANAFVASMDDIAQLVPDAAFEALPEAEAVSPAAAESVALEPSVILAEAVAVPEAVPAPVPVPEAAPAAASSAQQAPALGLPFDDA
ncbi:hypothetical protein BO221_25935 [Archangium sp. Cb G35]|uniref:hypothetical protein n=1 Tax=Archangium sp. Cb G35 TaxID=1920190 RepID=UPI00093585D9|nr:hypothetical protein [Archangium sp. Cb G35]OJT21273.1 hypothetical protein BO221_25935 [Archangium sp. Cb G35]